MTPIQPLSQHAAGLLGHPLVLRCAWRKLCDHHQFPWTRDSVEWVQWKRDPWTRMQEVCADLISGRYMPAPFLLIPYPKLGGSIRHYVRPSVRDEFAFLLLGVLLAPLLEARMWSFSFGGRWYRGIHRQRGPSEDSAARGELRLLPFSLSDRPLFQSYRRSYGLFRRLAHWTALRMLKVEREKGETAGGVLAPDDYPPDILPYLHVGMTRRNFRVGTETGGTKHAWHARLDLAAAYPCVRRRTLADRLDRMLAEPLAAAVARTALAVGDELPLSASPYRAGGPWDCLDGPDDYNRRELGRLWMGMLAEVRYHAGDGGDLPNIDEAWQPALLMGRQRGLAGHLRANDGIPTGLAVSSVWFNVYLHDLDQEMAHLTGLSRHRGTVDGTFFRFVDDMLILAPTPERARELAGGVARWLECGPTHGGSTPTTPDWWQRHNNLVLSTDKVKPEYLREWLHKRHATIAPTERSYCHDAPATPPDCQGRLDADDLGPFVTTLVETFSELGRPTLHDLFGTAAGERLAELHRLVRMTIDDFEVRLDTRMAFVGRRLASAPLPFPEERKATDRNAEAVESGLDQIGRSLRVAVLRAPWKFQLWEAVVRFAVRVMASDREAGSQWIAEMLRMLRRDGHLAWESWKPCDDRPPEVPPAQLLSLSWLRAAALIAHAMVVRDLARALVIDPVLGRSRWQPKHWAFPLMQAEDAEDALNALCAHAERSRAILYGEEYDALTLPWWEKEALGDLWTACRTASNAAKGVSKEEADGVTERWMRCRPDPKDIARLAMARYANDPVKIVQITTATGALPFVQDEVLQRAARALTSREADFWLCHPPQGGGTVLGDWQQLEEYGEVRKLFLSVLHARYSSLWSYLRRLSWTESELAERFAPSHRQRRSDGTDLLEILGGLSTPVDSTVRIASAPAEGLPPRLVAGLLRKALDADEGDLAVGWTLVGELAIAAIQRLHAWPMDGASAGDCPPIATSIWEQLKVTSSGLPSVPPHPLILLVHLLGVRTVDRETEQAAQFVATLRVLGVYDYLGHDDTHRQARREHNVLVHLMLALVALAGDEGPLDQLLDEWPVTRPPSGRMGWQDRFPMPKWFWEVLDRALVNAGRPLDQAMEIRLAGDFETDARPPFDAVSVITVDLRDSLAGLGLCELPGQCAPDKPHPTGTPPVRDGLLAELVVRMAQVEEWPDEAAVVHSWPDHPSPLAQWRSITTALPFRAQGDNHSALPHIVVLPEVTLPPDGERLIAQTVHRYGYAVLIGRYWRPVAASPRGARANHRWLTNEALLWVPLNHAHRPDVVRSFTIRKPFPNHEEHGLARALSLRTPGSTTWELLRGTRIYHFQHGSWGDFTVGICSDLLDPRPWARLRGRVHHILFVSMNQDASLFHAITRTRAYEIYANLVLVNHGLFGGSYAWSPERGYWREKARFDGRHLRVVSDIRLPVSALDRAQREQLEDSTQASAQRWGNPPEEPDPRYKTPPPGYRHGGEESP